MPKNIIKERTVEVLSVIGSLAWRGFGIFLFILGGSAGVGAVATGDPVTGIVIAWGTLMVSIVAAVGYAIATTGKATKATVHKAANDAVEKAQAAQESSKK